eukprot:2331373-Prymnesium_polylepis.1
MAVAGGEVHARLAGVFGEVLEDESTRLSPGGRRLLDYASRVGTDFKVGDEVCEAPGACFATRDGGGRGAFKGVGLAPRAEMQQGKPSTQAQGAQQSNADVQLAGERQRRCRGELRRGKYGATRAAYRRRLRWFDGRAGGRPERRGTRAAWAASRRWRAVMI